MKSRIITLSFLMVLLTLSLSAQTGIKSDKLPGSWKFEAPYAPEGFTTGTIEFAFADNKYTSSISFTGTNYKIPGDQTKVDRENVSFSVIVQDAVVSITLKQENDDKLTGKAVYSEGEIPLTLTRVVKDK